MTHSSLQTTLAAFSGKRVLVIGDVVLDEYIWGEVRRISPEAPVPVVEIRRRTYLPGGAANAAANVVSLGGVALLSAVVGQDAEADKLRDALTRMGVNPESLLVDANRPTTTKSRIVAHGQQVVRIDSEDRAALSTQVEDALLQAAARQLPRADACILSDYAKGVVTSRLAQQFIQLARQAGKPIIVDPKGTDFTKYRGATAIKPNLHELELFLKRDIHDDASLHEAGARLVETLEGTALLITRGSQGMTLFRQGVVPAHIATVARNVFDVTGAGDTVVSTLAMGLAAGLTLEQAVPLANQAAGIVVAKSGTATVTREELLAGLA